VVDQSTAVDQTAVDQTAQPDAPVIDPVLLADSTIDQIEADLVTVEGLLVAMDALPVGTEGATDAIADLVDRANLPSDEPAPELVVSDLVGDGELDAVEQVERLAGADPAVTDGEPSAPEVGGSAGFGSEV
jgi:hypothetical protein